MTIVMVTIKYAWHRLYSVLCVTSDQAQHLNKTESKNFISLQDCIQDFLRDQIWILDLYKTDSILD